MFETADAEENRHDSFLNWATFSQRIEASKPSGLDTKGSDKSLPVASKVTEI